MHGTKRPTATERLQVLLVEDDMYDASRVGQNLTGVATVAFRIDTARTLAQALKSLGRRVYDVVLLDLSLPDSSGMNTLRQVLAASKGPVAIVTADPHEELVAEALATGAADVFSKEEANSRLFSRSVLFVVERSHAFGDRRQLERVLSTLSDTVLVVADDGRVLYLNRAGEELFGQKKEAFIGERLGFSMPTEELSEITILRGEERRTCEIRIDRIEWRGEPSVMACVRDVTDRRTMETQLALSDRMTSIGTLAAGVAHEINNPLVSVLVNLDLAMAQVDEMRQRGPVPQGLESELKDAREAAERVRQIVRDIKLFSRGDEDSRGPINIVDVIETTVRMAWGEIKQRAQLVLELDTPHMVWGNASRLGQVFLNLLINAVHSIEPDKPFRNEIRIRAVEEAGEIVVSIRDTGTGMTPEVASRIFTAFYTTKPVGVGTGLGLAISQRIVGSFGGKLTFETAPGNGTEFFVHLRPADGPAGAANEHPSSADVGGVSPPPVEIPDDTVTVAALRIMVVDDEPDVLTAIDRVLGGEHQVVTFEDGLDALDRLGRDAAFDVIFTDVRMPRIGGMELYEKITSLGLGLESRVVFMTGGSFEPATKAFLDRIGNPVLEKPFEVATLRALVAEFATATAE